MDRVLRLSVSALVSLLLFWMIGGVALAEEAARKETLIAGPYTVNVSMDLDPPSVERPLHVTIVPQESALQLSGQIIAQPGPGTNASNQSVQLVSVAEPPGSLQGQVSFPVQGAWQLVIVLNGSQGFGSNSLYVNVVGPKSESPWPIWLIGLLPIAAIAWWIWQQRRPRQVLR